MSLLSTVRGITQRGSVATSSDLYRHVVPMLDGSELNLESQRGRPTLLVNTASQDGFAPQFHGLQQLYDRYREQGLLVLATPTGEFGGNELDEPSEIQQTVESLYDVEFPLTAPMAVRFDPSPFWASVAGQPNSGPPVWNFTKYLVGPDGDIRGWWSTNVRPENRRIRDAVEAILERG